MGAASVGKGLLCLCQQSCPSLPVNLAMALSLYPSGTEGLVCPQPSASRRPGFLGYAETQQEPIEFVKL